MIPGISGDLLSASFLDAFVTGDDQDGVTHGWMRAVLRWWRRSEETIGPATPTRTLLDVGARPLLELLDLRPVHVERHPWGHTGIVAHRDEPVATLASVVWGTPPQAAWRLVHRAGLSRDLPWVLLFTGTRLAVADAARPWARRFVVFDLAGVCRSPRALKLLLSLASGTALRGGADGRLARAVAASEAEGRVVCAGLGRGVLEALTGLAGELGGRANRGRTPSGAGDRLVFEQSLTIVYRLLFLLFAEARDLVPLWHRIYRDAYSMQALCDRVIDDPGAPGVWSAMQAMSRLAHTGCVVDDLRVTAFNGRLFAPRRTPLAESGHVSDAAAAGAVLSLATTGTRRGRQRIAFDDLGVEQLGAVYEQVLDYEPARAGGRLTLGATSAERKTSGSFYTPRPVTDFMVRRTLAPLVRGKSAEEMLRLRILDPAMGSGAFLVAACRYLTERIEQATASDDAWIESAGSDRDRAEISRLVAERCLYGIDRNATAVQLARLSLWLTTLASDRPLTFLDHHLGVGNSLIGARLADLAFPPGPLARRGAPGQPSLFDDAAWQAWGRSTVPERLRLALEPSHTAGDVRAKERRFEALARDRVAARWARAADLWCGLALVDDRTPSGLYSDLQQHVLDGETALAPRRLRPLAARAMAAARRHGALHWELLFPEVFVGPDGLPRPDAGFDAIIGNPPWEMVRADTGDDARRAGDRDEAIAVMRFVRRSGHYPLHDTGHVNHYQLFVERALQALRPGGRLGLILPSGLQADVGSAGVRRAMLDLCRIDTWMSFDNRAAIFPIHRSVRFLLVAGTSGGRTDALPVVDGGSDPSTLARLPDDPRAAHDAAPAVVLARAFLERWDPARHTVPLLGTPLAMAVAVTAVEVPALASVDGWGVTFGRELNATDDRRHFISGRRTPAHVAVIEGKHLRPFAVDAGATGTFIARSAATRLLGERWTRSRVAYRDVASATNRVSLIAAVLPADVVSTHTVFCAREPLGDADAWCLMGLLNSLVANYLTRVQMTTHVTAALMARLPVPRPEAGSESHRTIVGCAHRLAQARTFEDDQPAYARLNAVAARLYGLTAAQYRHVVSSFPLLPEALRAACIATFSSGFAAHPVTSATPPSR